MNSAAYVGTIRHRRDDSPPHAFTYRQMLLYIDLDEAPALFERARLWSMRRPAPGWLRRKDFIGDPDVPLAEVVRELAGVSGPVRLLTHARMFGHHFNPVSFYFCFRSSRLEAVVADVSNTPWGERHAYVIRRGAAQGQVIKDSAAKALHVSPFMGPDLEYGFSITEPGEDLVVHIDAKRDGARVFDATLSLRRQPLDLDRQLFRHTADTWRTLPLIYRNALSLRLKAAERFPHPRRV